jgi:hypothetical protein
VAAPMPSPPAATPGRQRTASPTVHFNGAAWVVGIFLLLLFFAWIASPPSSSPQTSNKASTPPSVRAPEAGPTPPQAESRPPTPIPPPRKPAPASLPEQMPPAGSDLVLSTPQIRYCLYQSARIDGMDAVVNKYSQIDVDVFNATISDYNSRCAKFRYRRGALDPIRSEVAANRERLANQGALVFLQAVGR